MKMLTIGGPWRGQRGLLWAPLTLCLLSCTGLVSGQGGGKATPPIIRLTPRQWDLPIDSKIGHVVTRLTIKDTDTHKDNITVSFSRVATRIGPFHDGSPYFQMFELKSTKAGVKKFDIELARSLQDKFKVGDQFNLYVEAHDGNYHSKNEVYGRIEEPRRGNRKEGSSLLPTEAPLPTSSSVPSVTNIPTSSPNSPKSTPIQAPALNTGEVQEKTNVVIIIVPIIAIATALGFGFACACRKRKHLQTCCVKPDKETQAKREIDNVLSTETEFTELASSRKTSMALSTFSSQYSEPPDVLIKQDWERDPWEFPRHHLKFFGILGEGCFGQVWKCEALNIDGVKGTSTVAVKTLKESASEKERKDLLQELEVMKMLKTHPNVVRLIGCCTQGPEKAPIYVIMEFVAKGKLQEFLRKSRAEHYYGNLYGSSQKLTSRDLTQFAHHVARGMEYLSSKKVIHRDLAARNVLVTDQNVCKVADFGFSRDVMVNNIYERKSEGRLPIRWMAPESLYDNIYTTKTDVWSFGVLLWEIVTLGSTPYPGMSGSEVMKRVKEGYRPEKPEHCDREIYNMMFYCWDKDPAERPSFTQLVKDLEALLTKDTDYIDLNQFPDHAYYNEVSLSGEKV